MIILTHDFSSETMQARRVWNKFWDLKQTYNCIPCETVLQKWRRNKDFFRKMKIEEFVASRLGLQEMLKIVLQRAELFKKESLIYIRKGREGDNE